jgi:hypothetical protein
LLLGSLLPHRGAGAPEGLFTFDELYFPGARGFAAAADFVQMSALDGWIGVSGKARQQPFHELGPPGAWQTKGV